MKTNTKAITTGVLLAVLAMSSPADQVILDDLIVDGSICVGQDCVNGESFGFDTIRLKENNLRIKFQDTSTSASFPSRDWQITINDSSNGGANKFSIDDIDGGRTPFTIEAGAPSHSLFVDDGGRVGFGTNVPIVDLHVKSGNTPTLRLEQDGSSGFGAQIWDVAGNETNFFIRDVTNDSKLPFRIFPGAPTNSITIKPNRVGIGTSSPGAALDIRATSPTPGLHIKQESDSELKFLVENNNQKWSFTVSDAANNGELRFSAQGTGGPEFTLRADGSVKIGAGGASTFVIDDSGNVTIDGDLEVTGTCTGCEALP